ncbi:ribosomal protein L4 domain-containing protein [Mycena galericulata]|nr:ribosomal protein L4 domain-containing protein [Mycena galericulata]
MASCPTRASTSSPLPAVLTAPIRLDVVSQAHKSIANNKRQEYSVSKKAGHRTSAESWGTGRAVARIPRVGGSATHLPFRRCFCARRIGVAFARGHRIKQIEDVPFVIASAAESFTKTNEAVALLKSLNAYADVIKVSNSRKLRAGKGKVRNRRHRQCHSPLVVYIEDNGIVKAFRNLPGVELANIRRLNLLQLGLAISAVSTYKKDYLLPTSKISNPDVTRLINSDEIQSKVEKRPWTQKKNPLVNMAMLFRLNPYAKTIRKHELLKQEHLKKDAKKPKHPTAAREAFTALPKASEIYLQN